MNGGPTSSPRRLRVALGSPGIGLVQRGFERFMRDIFEQVRGEVDATLFKGGGPDLPGERKLTFLPRGGAIQRALPLHRLIGRTPFHVECLTFAFAMLPALIAGEFDVVHVVDPPLARVLWHLRRLLRLRFHLLYTEGCAMPPGDYPPADFIQQVSPVTEAEAIAWGHDPARMRTIPCGFLPGRFVAEESREALRARHGIAPETFLVMAVSAINRGHKRTHHLIEEFAQLEGDALLWLDGSLDHGDPDLLDHARTLLGDRLRVSHVPSDKVGELYAMADVMPHAAQFEAFGLALVEAASCGVPMLAHDAPHFRWLLPNPACWVDMATPGALAARLAEMQRDTAVRAAATLADTVRERYDWANLRHDYVALYQALAAS